MDKEEKKCRAKQLTLEFVDSLKISAALKGCTYLVDAICISAMDLDLLHPISKKLFPIVAKNNECSVRSVERNIRKVIDIAFENDPEPFYKCLPYLDGKPYLTEIIAYAADMIHRELM